MTKKYRHLLFDLDGTLTDPMEGITRSVQYALRHFGIEVSDLRELCPFIGPPFAESFRTFYGFDDRQTSEAVAVSREYFTEKGIFENRLYDGMDALLDTLASSGYTLCVATSKPRVFAERILDHFGIAPYFSFVGGTGLDGSLPTKADVIAHVLAGSNITDRGTALMSATANTTFSVQKPSASTPLEFSTATATGRNWKRPEPITSSPRFPT